MPPGRCAGWLSLALLLCGIPSPVSAQTGEAQPEAGGEAAGAAEVSPFDEPSPAERRDQEARQLFQVGHLAFADGRFADALDAFQRAYRLSDRPPLLFNIGAALDRLRRNREALRYFERYLEALPDAENRAEVTGRMAVLRETIEREQQAEVDRRERDRLLAERDREGGSVLSEWWFWTLVGAVVAGGVVTAIVLTREDEVQGPEPGSTGQVTMTLGWP